MTDSKTRIGLIGVGLMGHGIASNIARHGYPLTFLNHSGNQPTGDLLEAGATRADNLSAIAEQTSIIILCVTGTPQVEDILYGDNGLVGKLRTGTIIIDCSTAMPSSTEKTAERVGRAGSHFLDAPMTRTPKEAALGRLNLIVGGDSEIFEQCKPVLSSFAENIFYAGKAGSGHRMKLIHNFVSLGFSTVLAEAVACASRAGVSSKVVLDILESGGGQGAVLSRLTPYIESQDNSGFRFSLANACKDLGYYNDMADETHCFHDTATAVKNTLATGMGLSPNATIPELISLLQEAGR